MNLFKQYAERLLFRSTQMLSQKRYSDAKRTAGKALMLDPSLENAWLIMAATSEPTESIRYLKKVLRLNPQNVKAIRGLDWVNSKIRNNPNESSTIYSFNNELSEILKSGEIQENQGRSILKRISSRWQTLFALISVLVIIFIGAASPLLAPNVNPNDPSLYKVVCERYHCIPEPPSDLLPLGSVKEFDVYHTLIWGMRQSLVFGLITASMTAFIGTFLGLVSAYYGGWFDRLIMRTCDAFMAFPIIAGVALFAQLSVLLSASNVNLADPAIVTPNFFQTIILKSDPILIALILFSWMGYTRIIHSQVLHIKREEYVKAANVCGARNFRIIFKHILPNSITPAIIMATRDIGRMVVIQSSLTFIGVGGSSAWATLLNLGKDWIIGPGGNLLTRWWIYLPITLALVFFGVTWGFVGDELNHWMNPKNA